MKKYILMIAMAVLLSSCADTVTFEQAMTHNQVGFWHGLWHGICVPFSFIGSWFMDDVSIYAIYNNGGWYDFGFFLGVSSIFGGSSSQARK